MKYYILVLALFSIINAQAAKQAHSFIVEVKDRSIKVTSPSKKLDVVSVVIKNDTFDKIISVLKSKDKVIKRFVLQSQGEQVIEVDLRNNQTLYYVPISPPFESVELKFKQRPYEVPEKK